MQPVDSFDDVIREPGRVFRDVGPISDLDLCPSGFAVRSSANEGLDELRGMRRLDLAASRQWMDAGALRRMSPCGAWHFAPSIMLMAHRHLDRFEFAELLQLFVFKDAARDLAHFKPLGAGWEEMGLMQCLDRTPSANLGMDWRRRYLSFFSTVERKAVVAFLHWLQAQWPGDPDIGASINAIWAG